MASPTLAVRGVTPPPHANGFAPQRFLRSGVYPTACEAKPWWSMSVVDGSGKFSGSHWGLMMATQTLDDSKLVNHGYS